MLIDINGKLLATEESTISVFDSGYQYGFSIYETFFIKNGVPVFYEDHMARFFNATNYFGFKMDQEDVFKNVQKRILKLNEANSISTGRCRLTVSGKDWNFPSFKMDSLNTVIRNSSASLSQNPIRMKVHSLPRYPTGFPSFVKLSGNYYSILSFLEAKNSGFDEGIMLLSDGTVTEGSFCNLFWETDGHLFTPSLNCGILDGVTRKVLIDSCKNLGIHVIEGIFHLSKLLESDKAYISSSTRGLLEIGCIDDRQFQSQETPLAMQIREDYNKSLEKSILDFVS